MVKYDYICTLNYNPNSLRSVRGMSFDTTWNLAPLRNDPNLMEDMVMQGVDMMINYEMRNGGIPDVECRARLITPGSKPRIQIKMKRERETDQDTAG